MASKGTDNTPTGNDAISRDLFTTQHNENNDPLTGDKVEKAASSDDLGTPESPTQDNLRMSREWDASKVPPSQFQHPKGSIFATPNTRDGHVKGAERDQKYWDKLREKGWMPEDNKK